MSFSEQFAWCVISDETSSRPYWRASNPDGPQDSQSFDLGLLVLILKQDVHTKFVMSLSV